MFRQKTERSICEVIAEILECGPIVACDPELGIIVGANGAYFNTYGPEGQPYDCHSRDKDFYETTAAQLWDEAKEFIESLRNGDDSDEEE